MGVTGGTMNTRHKRQLRLLHLIASPKVGGAEKLLLAMLDRIDRGDCRIAVGVYLDARTPANALYAELEKRRVDLFPIVIRSACDLRQLPQLYHCVKQFRPDVIHTHGYKTNILGYLVSRLCGVPIVSTVHGWLHTPRRVTRCLNRLNLFLLRHFERVIAVSTQIERSLLESGFSAARLVQLHNIPPIELDPKLDRIDLMRQFGLSPQARTVGFVGRLEPVKGGQFFVAAAQEVLLHFPATQFVVAGEGSELETLRMMAERSGISARFKFLGFVERPEEVYSVLDLFVLPSLDEGIPLALLEAMTADIPVIASAVGGVPEVVEDGVNGILVPPADSQALAAAICRGLEDEAGARERIRAARQTISRRFDVGAWVENLQALYQEMMA